MQLGKGEAGDLSVGCGASVKEACCGAEGASDGERDLNGSFTSEEIGLQVGGGDLNSAAGLDEFEGFVAADDQGAVDGGNESDNRSGGCGGAAIGVDEGEFQHRRDVAAIMGELNEAGFQLFDAEGAEGFCVVAKVEEAVGGAAGFESEAGAEDTAIGIADCEVRGLENDSFASGDGDRSDAQGGEIVMRLHLDDELGGGDAVAISKAEADLGSDVT